MHESSISIMPLGAGTEVGRSCIHVNFSNTAILFDIGVHPAYVGISTLPFLDLVDLSTVTAIFVTHFHLDHAGALPFLTEKTRFKGKVYMTHPTFHILRYLLNDYTRLINASSNVDFYTEEDLDNCFKKIIPIDYNQEVFVKDLKVVALNAGHVLGAAMFTVTKRGHILLYTGDYSTEEDRHLKPAESPGKVDTLIVESTYGVQCHLPRKEREDRFTATIKTVLQRGGKVLLPVFALGRAQELLLILEEYWQKNKELHKIPIYYASALAKRCIGIYQTYSSASKSVNFNFKYISSINVYEDSNQPCVVMASPGMLQSGLSRDLFEKWCEDSRNGVLIAGYCVNGTLAKDIMNEPDEIESARGERLKLRCSVDYISFSAHVDFIQNSAFINECQPLNIFLVHGEVNEMNRLKNALKRENIHCLRNGEKHEIILKCERIVRMRDVKEGCFELIMKGREDLIEVRELDNEREVKFKQRAFIPLPDVEEMNRYLKNVNQVQNQERNISEPSDEDHHKSDRSEGLMNKGFNKVGPLVNENFINEDDSSKNKNVDNFRIENSLGNYEGGVLENIQCIENSEVLNNNIHTGEGPKNADNASLLVKNENLSTLIKKDLFTLPNMSTNQILEFSEKIPHNARIILIRNILYDFFDDLTIEGDKLKISEIILTITDNKLFMEWSSSYKNDLIATTIVRLIKNIGKTIESIKISKLDKNKCLLKILKNYFDNIKVKGEEIIIKERDEIVRIVNNEVIKDKSMDKDGKIDLNNELTDDLLEKDLMVRVGEILSNVNLIFDR